MLRHITQRLTDADRGQGRADAVSVMRVRCRPDLLTHLYTLFGSAAGAAFETSEFALLDEVLTWNSARSYNKFLLFVPKFQLPSLKYLSSGVPTPKPRDAPPHHKKCDPLYKQTPIISIIISLSVNLSIKYAILLYKGWSN